MTPTQAYIFLAVLYSFDVFAFIFLYYWLVRNRIELQTSETIDGVNMLTFGRYRLIKGKLYSRWDFFRRRPLTVPNVEKYLITTEGAPIIGINRTLKLKWAKYEKYFYLIPWLPQAYNITGRFNNLIMAWCSRARSDVYEATKLDLTRAEMLNKIVIPIMLVVLAVACLIFFPKIYDTINAGGRVVAQQALTGFKDTINQYVPLG